MKIAQSFLDAQKRVFQDKTIGHYSRTNTKDAEGNVIAGTPTLVSTLEVNVIPISDKVIAEDWGLRLSKDIQITISSTTVITRTDLIKYKNSFYEVVGKDERDAYTALYCRLNET
jgi:hypothetical protein